MKTVKILICDDHTMVSQALAGFLEQQNFIKSVYICTTAAETIKKYETEFYDIAILDVNMEEMSGIVLAGILSTKYENIKIIMLSMRSDLLTVKESIKAGANGYLLKNADLSEVKNAISRVIDGKSYFSKQISQALLDDQLNLNSDKEEVFITPREREILLLIVKEYHTKQISETLNISENTVETHRKNIMKKTNTKTSVGLVRYAIERSLF